MPGIIEAQISNWLKLLDIHVSKQLLKKRLESHPDHPSLLSITDTLTELNIPNTAVHLSKEQVAELDIPFLAHLRSNGGGFLTVADARKIPYEHPAFYEDWDGVVILAEKEGDLTDNENVKYLRIEKRWLWLNTLAVVIIGGLSFISIYQHFSLINAALLSSSMLGLFFAILIVLHERGAGGRIMERFCRTTKTTDCNSIINADSPWLTKWLKFSDVGLIYFGSQFFLFLSAFGVSNANAIKTWWFFIAAASVPFIFFSVYYQKFVKNKWCVFCLCIIGVLGIQFFLFLYSFIYSAPVFDWRSALIIPAVLFLGGIAWLAFKAAMETRDKTESQLWEAFRFKDNTDIFWLLLREKRRIVTTPFDFELQLGNADAALQVLVACNFYCGPCARAHKLLHELIDDVGDQIGLTIRFTVTQNTGDRSAEVLGYMLNYLLEAGGTVGSSTRLKREVLANWFEWMDFEKFKNKYPVAGKYDVTEILRVHTQWVKKSDIRFTPTIFVNGYELPSVYQVPDLARAAGKLIATVQQQVQVVPKSEIAAVESF
jgi:hypothetical protein